MEQTLNLNFLLEETETISSQILTLLKDPTFWPQFVAIVLVFAIAQWLILPLINRLLDMAQPYTQRIPSLQRPSDAMRDIGVPISWLVLQWTAIHIFAYINLRHGVLLTVASLLSAWVLIRLATTLVKNKSVAKTIAIIAWTVAALNIFGLLEDTLALLDSWSYTVGGLRLSPLTLFKIALALWFALWLANTLSGLMERSLQRSTTTSAATRVLIAKLFRIALITLAILIALNSVGIDFTALAVFGGALGVGLGFGLQKIFSNLVSGIMLLMDKSIKPGDVISLGTTFGWINHLGLRYTSVITRDGMEHLIPNEELITQRVENWSFSNKLIRLRIPVGVAYNTDVRQAMSLCLEAVEMIPRVQLDPEPRVQLIGFGDSSVNLEIRIWIDDPENGRANITSEVLLAVWDKFHEHNIGIPFPQRDLHIRSVLGETEIAAIHTKNGVD
jgi:small-conductance mechanosensitive channel